MGWIHKKKSHIRYWYKPIFLDIETSHNHNPEAPKTWITSICCRFNGHTRLFRNVEKWVEWMKLLIILYSLNADDRMVVYIHNASYDLSYLIPYIQRDLPGYDNKSGIMDGKKIIVYQQPPFEFRCTYLLTGKSLEMWGKDFDVEHKKKIGMYDYNKILFPDTPLSDQEQKYIENDVICMEECFAKQLEFTHDNVATIPLTATGYVRRDLRTACNNDYYRNNYFNNSILTAESYLYCLNSYAGGYTHNNRFKRSTVQVGPIGHRDFRSHYPSQIRCYPLPFGKAEVYYDCTKKYHRKRHGDIRIQQILDLHPRFYTISKILITKCELINIDECSMPFLQRSKMFQLSENSRLICDNGRLLKMIRGSFVTYLDNYTLQIISEQYKLEYEVIKVYRFKNKMCPDCIAGVIDQYFAGKTNYKMDVKRCAAEYGEGSLPWLNASIHMMLSKNRLNAIYGCMATNPLKDDYMMDFRADPEEPIVHKAKFTSLEEIEEGLQVYYGKRNSFLPYQVGCAVTSLARFELYQYIKCIGYDKVLYCDTDSIFYFKDPEVEHRIEALNQEKHKTAAFIVSASGERIYYDVFEAEPDITHFKGLHSKCYGVVENGRLKITIAGIPARTITGMNGEDPIYLSREAELSGSITDPVKALDQLRTNFEFSVNTGTTALYRWTEPHKEMINGHEIDTAGGCIINKLSTKAIKDVDIMNIHTEEDIKICENLN